MVEIGLAVLAIACGVIGYLLNRKDAAQASQIALLFTKHDEDVKRLQEVELDIARRHYVKDELDSRFDKLEVSIGNGLKELRDGIKELGNKFDKLNSTMRGKGSEQ